MSFQSGAAAVTRPLRIVKANEGSPFPKASLWLRLGARAFDGAVAFGMYSLATGPGPVLVMLFLLFADGMLEGQSIGKRLFGVRVVHLPTRCPARFRESALRNAPFALIVLLGMMPRPLGYVALAAGVLSIGCVEAWKVVRDPLGWRLGDIWAQTQVVDGKVVVGSMAPAVPAAPQEPGGVFRSGNEKGGLSLRRKHRCASR
jgi:hypothetical protein